MSTRLEMLQVARLAPRLLGESAQNIQAFARDQMDGGAFCDRQGKADLYYTIFGLDILEAVLSGDDAQDRDGQDPSLAGIGTFLDTIGDPASPDLDLDLVHLACLIRARSASGHLDGHLDALAGRVLDLRRDDGGWAMTGEDEASTSYGTFLAVGALQDLGLPVGRPSQAAEFLHAMILDDGGFALDAATPVATTPTTAASIVALRQLGARAPSKSAEWMLGKWHRQGGFLAAEGAPMPDLLSTAVALHALSVLEATPDHLKETLLDFVDTLWSSKGGFYGHWADDAIDVEYTFYGLLALGHLAVMDS